MLIANQTIFALLILEVAFSLVKHCLQCCLKSWDLIYVFQRPSMLFKNGTLKSIQLTVGEIYSVTVMKCQVHGN